MVYDDDDDDVHSTKLLQEQKFQKKLKKTTLSLIITYVHYRVSYSMYLLYIP